VCFASMALPPARDFVAEVACHCFALRTVIGQLWAAHDDPVGSLELTLQATPRVATLFYHHYQGSYGWPGEPPGIYLLDARANAIRDGRPNVCLWRSTTSDTLSWTVCNNPEDCGHVNCGQWGFEAEGAPDRGFFLRAPGCTSSAQCKYVGRTAPNSAGPLRMIEFSNASRFEAVCDVCPGTAIGVGGTLCCLGLAIIALLPTARFVCSRGQRRRLRQERAANVWPQRQHSIAALTAFQLGWALVVLGVTPWILWNVGRWWTGSTSDLFGLVPLGMFLMILLVRPDDSPLVMRAASALVIFIFATLTVFAVIHALDWWVGAYHVASLAWAETWRRGMARLLAACSVLLVTLYLSVMHVPIHGIKLGCAAGTPRAHMSTEAGLRRLWGSLRTAIVLLTVALVVQYMVVVIGILCATPPVDDVFVSLDWPAGSVVAGVLLALAVSSPGVRLAIQLGRLRLGVSPRRFRPYLRPPPVVHASVVHASVVHALQDSPTNDVADSNGQGLVNTIPSGSVTVDRDTGGVPSTISWAISALSGSDNTTKLPGGVPSSVPWCEDDMAVPVRAPAAAGSTTASSLTYGEPSASTNPLVSRGRRQVTKWCCDVSAWDNAQLKYSLEEHLGRGHYSDVYRATDAEGGSVALKIFNPNSYGHGDARHMSSLLAEVELTTQLEHPNLVRAIGKLLFDGRWPALAMEYMAGSSLDAHLHHSGTSDVQSLTPEWQLSIATDVARGLMHLHDKLHISHRDLKAANVLLDAQRHLAKIGDFGLATRFGAENSTAGTLRYMAPEVVLGAYDHKADVFSYGMLLWELFHVARPFSKLTGRQVVQEVQSAKRPRVALPQALKAYASIITTCWAQDACDRPEMTDVVAKLLEPGPIVR